jgi:hypothetical protein
MRAKTLENKVSTSSPWLQPAGGEAQHLIKLFIAIKYAICCAGKFVALAFYLR